MRVVEAGPDAARLVRSMVSSAMGRLHGYYASTVVENGSARVLVAYDGSGKARGVEVFYNASIDGMKACIHYYVVVARGWRGMGIGKVLVLSAEELCRADVYLATTTWENMASRRMFQSLCYEEHAWDEIEEAYGWDAVSELVKLTCGYEDDLVLVKPGKNMEELLKALERRGAPKGVWNRVCYEPWRMLFTL